jgi:hypothetical protein
MKEGRKEEEREGGREIGMRVSVWCLLQITMI